MIIGHLIKRERIKNNIKQVYLANGICSPSYLSKIENNETTPSAEILNLLFQKLDIFFEEINVTSADQVYNDNLNSELLDVYKKVSITRNKEYSKEKIEELHVRRFEFLNRELFYMYNLVMMRLLLSDSNNLNNWNSYLEPLLKDIDLLDNYKLYLLKKLNGIYFFYCKEYIQALNKFSECLSLLSKTNIRDWEKADLYYMYSLISLKSNVTISAIEYSQKALDFFIDELQFDRALDCYLIQAISYKNSKKYNMALDIYNKAIIIIEKFGFENYKPIVYQNIGTLHASLQSFQKALNFYFKSLNYKKNPEDRLLTILSIIKVYSKRENVEKLMYWINIGLSEAEAEAEKNIDIVNYIYHFNFYAEIHKKEGFENLTSMIENMKYFESIKDYRHVAKYCIKIGDILVSRKKYKDASKFYKSSVYASIKNQGLDYWEDI